MAYDLNYIRFPIAAPEVNLKLHLDAMQANRWEYQSDISLFTSYSRFSGVSGIQKWEIGTLFQVRKNNTAQDIKSKKKSRYNHADILL